MSRFRGSVIVGAAVVAVLGLAGCGGPEAGSVAFWDEAKASCHRVVSTDFTNPIRFETTPAPEQVRQFGDNWIVGGYLDNDDFGIEQTFMYICKFDSDGNVLNFHSDVYNG